MILRILFIFLFVVLCGFVLYFIYGIFIPAVKAQIQASNDPMFADVELNYVGGKDDHKVVVSNNIAFIDTSGNKHQTDTRLNYNGVKSCKLFASIYDTNSYVSNVCVGFGDCVKICPQQAIELKNNVAVVTKNCCGCGKCLSICPKNIIRLIPKDEYKGEISEKKYFKFWKSCYKIFNK